MDNPLVSTVPVLSDLRNLIEHARQLVAHTANSTLTMLYWQVGIRIRQEVLMEERAVYGKQIVSTLSEQLVRDYGKGFNVSALNRMLKFAEVFPDGNIVATLSQQLSWSHFIEILPLKRPLERDYYAEMCRIERWSVRTPCASESEASSIFVPLFPNNLNTSFRPKSVICTPAGR